jgi:hypothetical protein
MNTLKANGQNNNDVRALYWVNQEALETLAEEIAEANRRHDACKNSLLEPLNVPHVKLPAASIEKLRQSNKTFLEKRRQQALLRRSKPTGNRRPHHRTTLILIIAIGLISTLATIATTVRF